MGELSLEHPKSEKLYFDGLFLSKAFNVSARKFQRNYVSWHWRVMQNLKENWLVAWKITSGICLIFMRAVESLEICTFIGFFCAKHTNIEMKKYCKVMTLDSKNDVINLANFNLRSGKSENSHFNMLLLSIAYKVSAEKIEKNYLSWHWRAMQSLKRN